MLGRDIKPTVGMRVKLTDAGKEYCKLYDEKHKTQMMDDGIGTIMAGGRSVYAGMVGPLCSHQVLLYAYICVAV